MIIRRNPRPCLLHHEINIYRVLTQMSNRGVNVPRGQKSHIIQTRLRESKKQNSAAHTQKTNAGRVKKTLNGECVIAEITERLGCGRTILLLSSGSRTHNAVSVRMIMLIILRDMTELAGAASCFEHLWGLASKGRSTAVEE